MNGNPLSELIQHWINEEWTNRNKKFYTNDYNNRKIDCESYGWENNAWVPENQFLTCMIDDQELIPPEYLSQFEVYYSKSSPGAIGEINYDQSNSIIVIPNPAGNNIQILFTKPLTEPVIVNILNISGEIIRSFSIENNPAFTGNPMVDVSYLNSGLYFIQINSGNHSEVEKLVITK